MGNDPLAETTSVWGEGEESDGAGNSVRFRKPQSTTSTSDPGNLTNENSGNLPKESNDPLKNYQAFNQVNEFQRGITEGTYSVTRTWQVANMFGFGTPAWDILLGTFEEKNEIQNLPLGCIPIQLVSFL